CSADRSSVAASAGCSSADFLGTSTSESTTGVISSAGCSSGGFSLGAAGSAGTGSAGSDSDACSIIILVRSFLYVLIGITIDGFGLRCNTPHSFPPHHPSPYVL